MVSTCLHKYCSGMKFSFGAWETIHFGSSVSKWILALGGIVLIHVI